MAGGWSCVSHISTAQQCFICQLSFLLDCTMEMLLMRLAEHKSGLEEPEATVFK